MAEEGKKNTDKWFDVVLVDETDFKTPETGKAFGDVTVKYKFEAATSLSSYTVTTDDWKEAGEGNYSLRIGASEFTNIGKYQVQIVCTGCLTYRFVAEVKTQTSEETSRENGYEGKIWIDEGGGTAGDTPYIHGKKSAPTDNPTRAKTINNTLKYNHYVYFRESATTVVWPLNFGGSIIEHDQGPLPGLELNLNSKFFELGLFKNIKVIGTLGDEHDDPPNFEGCIVDGVTNLAGKAKNCIIEGTNNLGDTSNATMDFYDCVFNATLTGTNAASTTIITGSGTITLDDFDSKTVKLYGKFDVTINASCNASTFVFVGNIKYTDNGVSSTIDDTQNEHINRKAIKDQTDKLTFNASDYLLVDLRAIENDLTNGNNAILKLKSLDIKTGGANLNAINIEGNYAGKSGFSIDGGAGKGMYIRSSGDNALGIENTAANPAFTISGGNGIGLEITSALSKACRIASLIGNNTGLEIRGSGTGKDIDAGEIDSLLTRSARLDALIEDVSGDRFTTKALETTKTQATTALSDIGLDHLISVAGTSGDITDNSFLAQMVDNNIPASWANFSNATASLNALSESIGNIASVGAPVNKRADSFVPTTVTVVSGTYEDTWTLDQVYHHVQDAGNVIDEYYEFNIGGGATPTAFSLTGRLQGVGEELDVYAWNWTTSTWEQIGTINGQASSDDIKLGPYALFTGNVGTGPDAGKVRIRYYKTGMSTPDFYIDQQFASYAPTSQTVGYVDGAIWYNDSASNTNTVPFVDGTADNPVSTWAAVLSLSAALNIKRVRISNGSSVTLTTDSTNFSLIGSNWYLDLNGQTIASIYTEGAVVLGQGLGESYDFKNCEIGNGSPVTLDPGNLNDCQIRGDVIFNSEGCYCWDKCASAVAGIDTPSVDFGASAGNVDFSNRHYSGGIEIKNFGTDGSDKMSIEGHGQLIFNANCDPSNNPEIAMRGHWTITDNVAGGFVAGGGVISDDARYDTTQILDQVNASWNEATTELSSMVNVDTATKLELLKITSMVATNEKTETNTLQTLIKNAGGAFATRTIIEGASTTTVGKLQ